IAGCLAALEVMEGFVAAGVEFDRTVEVVVWAGEEGSGRFDVGLIGSRAMVGELTENHLDQRCRLTGEVLRAAMANTGAQPDRIHESRRADGSIAAVLELHI